MARRRARREALGAESRISVTDVRSLLVMASTKGDAEMRSLDGRSRGVRLGSTEGRRRVVRMARLVAATVAAVAAVLLLPLGAAAAQNKVELEGRLSVAVSED